VLSTTRRATMPGPTLPGLPKKKGRTGTMTHDYKRNGTSILFAAPSVLKASVTG
jgi:hypothetical protein